MTEDWHPTPEWRRFYAKVYVRETGEWVQREYSDLRKGDIFKAFRKDGVQIDPGTGEPTPNPETVAVAAADAGKNTIEDVHNGCSTLEYVGQGYRVELEDRAGPLDAVLRKLSC